jgi:hypothetical protein
MPRERREVYGAAETGNFRAVTFLVYYNYGMMRVSIIRLKSVR